MSDYSETGAPKPLNPKGGKIAHGWPTVKSGNLFSFVTSGSRGWAKYYRDSGPLFLRVGNLDHDSVSLDLRDIQRVEPPAGAEGTRTKVHVSDILISVTADVGMIGLVPSTLGEAYINQHVALARPLPTVHPPFLAWWLASPRAQRQFRQLQRGATKVGLGLEDIRSVDVPFPSLPEQQRIVAEIEKQFTRLEVGVAALRRVQANLKRYRTSVLKAACEGRLVVSDLSAWRRLKVSEIGEAVTGNTPPTSDKGNLGDELPFFKPTDLDAGYNVRVARQYLSPKGAKLARVLPAGSVLVTCIGATIGKTGFARLDCATNQQINALVVNPKVATPEWIFWSIQSPDGQQQIKNNASATTLPILNKSKFEALKLLVPPLAEQIQIVAEVERRLSVVEELAAVVSANLQRATRLRQAILEQAFTGKLTS